jgi:C1A family cysteine protease
MSTKIATGWVPDFPDFRDYKITSQKIKDINKPIQKDSVAEMMMKVGVLKDIPPTKTPTADISSSIKNPKTLPRKMDKIREFCSPVENQGDLGSCTAHAGAALIEYYENKAFGKSIKVSRLFIYKAARNLLKWEGDQGAFLRSTMGALTLFGACPEEYWPYVEKKFDDEPPAFCYSFAANYQALNYYRIDTDKARYDFNELLKRIKINIHAELPMIFGFSVFSSIEQSFTSSMSGKIPFPTDRESNPEGHAVMVVGYDDNMKIKNKLNGGSETTGALIIRNSWGKEWGNDGYGWLPYDYVKRGLTSDWWSLLKNEWVDTQNFKA